MDNTHFYFYLSKILEQISSEILAFKNVMFILMINKKMLDVIEY